MPEWGSGFARGFSDSFLIGPQVQKGVLDLKSLDLDEFVDVIIAIREPKLQEHRLNKLKVKDPGWPKSDPIPTDRDDEYSEAVCD